MKVKQLIKELSKYPPDAEVDILEGVHDICFKILYLAPSPEGCNGHVSIRHDNSFLKRENK